ncbi:glycosyltransferase family 2 protein [Devosia sp. A16]|uniref:glycosyltransferase family 2 protein n=1 Tax=Devosia sp. A16 TaxID=1736675 RepID=UPI000A86C846|nr:glycosyltransferase family A protein [Devosia sp. A16]
MRQIYLYDRTFRSATDNTRTPHTTIAPAASAVTGPLVSCLMVTRGDLGRVHLAIEQFNRQTYAPRELVIVCDAVSEALDALVGQAGHNVRLVRASGALSLGELRNLSVAEAQGDLVCQWDDDDLYSADRIAHGVGALLQVGADALFLRQWFMWCPAQQVLVLSRSRMWEGSMIARKAALASYPALSREEDTRMVDAMVPRSSIALLDDPLSYCYCIHGQNTSPGDHMQVLIDTTRPRFRYAEGVAAFAANFAFASHPALGRGEAERIIGSASPRGIRREARRLRLYTTFSPLIRRFRGT